MAIAIVFHLQGEKNRRMTEVILRYDFDPACEVESGDVWERTSAEGGISSFLVRDTRCFEGIYGAELHVFMNRVLLIAE